MTIQQMIDKIIAYHPDLGERETCDSIKCGDPSAPLAGIAVCCAPTYPVLQQAVKAG